MPGWEEGLEGKNAWREGMPGWREGLEEKNAWKECLEGRKA